MADEVISIIVPVYNTVQYISRCIDSLLMQDYENVEIILVDDGSDDGSLERCVQYADACTRITVLQQKHAGPNAARLNGVEHCNGKYVAFCDSDDWLEKDYISQLAGCLLNCPDSCSFVISDLIIECSDDTIFWEHENLKEGVLDQNTIKKEIVPNYLFLDENRNWSINHAMTGKLYRTDLLYSALLETDKSISFNEDGLVNCHILLHSDSIYYKRYSGYHYMYRQNSICNQPSLSRANEMEYALLPAYCALFHGILPEAVVRTKFYQKFQKRINWNKGR